VKKMKKNTIFGLTSALLALLLITGCSSIIKSTINSTSPETICTMEAKICPDGSAVGRAGPDCAFELCPGEKRYVVNSSEKCKAVKFACANGEQPFFDTKGCGCEREAQNPVREYVADNVTVCAATTWICKEGQQQFFDDTGCGCEKTSTANCGDGVCDAGEADSCPTCYYSTPPCLAPCTAGTCPEDCAATTGKLKATDCPTGVRNQACTREYMPVCGWFDPVKIQCIRYPCAATYNNKCTACADDKVISWTEGGCPNGNA
jgi:hypothetical protein